LRKLIGGFALQAAVAVMAVAKRLKVLTLPFQMRIAIKPLTTENFFTVIIVKVFYVTVTPRFTDGYKYRLNAMMET